MYFSLLILLVVCIDQFTKGLIVRSFVLYEYQEIIPGFFNLVYCTNTGAAFSMGAGAPSPLRHGFFIGITLIALVFIVYLYWKHKGESLLYLYGFGLIAGGAVGNMVDRIRKGAVTDFLDFYIGSHHWPAFNVADSAITLGTALIILVMFVTDQSEKEVS